MLASPLRPGHHHVDTTAAALRANQPATPFRNWRLWPIRACLLGGFEVQWATTCFTLDHKPELGRCGAFERHRRASVGLHLTALPPLDADPGKESTSLATSQNSGLVIAAKILFLG
jgi:hypothetical protein